MPDSTLLDPDLIGVAGKLRYGSMSHRMVPELRQEDVAVSTGDIKGLYLHNIRSAAPRNLQKNWERIVLEARRGDEGLFRTYSTWLPEKSQSTERIVEAGIDAEQIVDFVSSHGRESVIELWNRLQDTLSPAALHTVARTLQEVIDATVSATYSVERCRIESREDFVLRANRLDRSGHRNAAMDLLYDRVDELMRSGKLELLDSVLRGVRIQDLSLDVLLGLLTATLPVRRRLPSRPQFFKDIERVLRERDEYEHGLLTGLE